jgi:hypothetical protein
MTRIVSLLLVYRDRLGEGTEAAASASAPQAPPPTIASTVDRQISTIEKQIVDAAEAMAEGKFNFSPESLKLPGANYKGVRTFALQVKHVTASNYAIWSHHTGEKFPAGLLGGNGPESLKAKADILTFVCSGSQGRGYVSYLEHIADRAENSKSLRLYLATFAIAHGFDHYGQMVEYLRMNGIVPPAQPAQHP